MHASQLPAGSQHQALVVNFYGVYEVTANVVADYVGAPAFVFNVPMVRGKGGKEAYMVVGAKRQEDDGFVLL